MAEHSPGPWDIMQDAYDPHRRSICTGRGDTLKFAPVAFMTRTTDDPRTEANAKLIAAAPDLLAACKAAMTCCGDHSNWQGETRAFLLLAEAAVAKAEGRS